MRNTTTFGLVNQPSRHAPDPHRAWRRRGALLGRAVGLRKLRWGSAALIALPLIVLVLAASAFIFLMQAPMRW